MSDVFSHDFAGRNDALGAEPSDGEVEDGMYVARSPTVPRREAIG